MKKENIVKNTSLNDKGFTFVEIIAVVVILGILLLVVGVPVSNYVLKGKSKTYESYKKDLAVASENLLVQCMANNEEGCDIPSYGNDVKITYSELVAKGYSKKLKDPEGNGYCDDSYVVATNKSQDGIDIEYKVCLFCDNYKTKEEGCTEVYSNDTTPPTCGDVTGESEVWSKDNKVITVGCTDKDSGCSKDNFSRSIGTDNEVITESNITIKDNAGNKTNCPVKVYVDRKAPTCKIEIEQSSNDGWYKKGIVAKLVDVQDDGSGISEKGMGTSLTNRTYNEKTSYEVTGGIVTVFGYVKDNVGNEGYCSMEVKVDNTKPLATLYMGYEIYPKENGIREDSKLTINNLDYYTDIEGLIVYFDEKIENSISSSVYNSAGNNIKLSGGITEGSNKAIIKFKKGTYESLVLELGNTSYFSKITKIEAIKNETKNSLWTNKGVTVFVHANDTISGVDGYSFDDGVTYSKENTKTYTSNATGTVYVKDKVGNLSNGIDFTIDNTDKTAPSAPKVVLVNNNWEEISGDAWYNYNVFVSGSTDENSAIPSSKDNEGGSGIAKYQISKDNQTWVDWNYHWADDHYGILNDGVYYRYIRAIDNAGNISEVTKKTIKIDKTSPILNVTGYKCSDANCTSKSTTLDQSAWVNTGGWFDYTASDSNFDYVKFEYNDSGNFNKNTTITGSRKKTDAVGYDLFTVEGYRVGSFIAYDKAGNSTRIAVETKIDRTGPQLKLQSHCKTSSGKTLCGLSGSRIRSIYEVSDLGAGLDDAISWRNNGTLYNHSSGTADGLSSYLICIAKASTSYSLTDLKACDMLGNCTTISPGTLSTSNISTYCP